MVNKTTHEEKRSGGCRGECGVGGGVCGGDGGRGGGRRVSVHPFLALTLNCFHDHMQYFSFPSP